jgi:cyclic lactone autoinducer peptide
MNNKLRRIVQKVATTLFRHVAFSTSASACANFYYQPKEPKCLQNK